MKNSKLCEYTNQALIYEYLRPRIFFDTSKNDKLASLTRQRT
jgi:hypothetical protein